LYPEHIQKEIEKNLDNMLMAKIDIQYMTGKAGIELIKSKAIETRVYEGIIDSAMEIRQEVFVEEQGFEDEFDDIDRRATHIVLIDKYNKEEKPITTCRVFQKEGSTEEAEKCVRKKGGTSISLHSQCSAKGFYQKQGYEEYGKIENEQGCPHIWMKKGLKS
jgi:predicted GNAT family N-acyltransferase